jgi:hypothetical protein
MIHVLGCLVFLVSCAASARLSKASEMEFYSAFATALNDTCRIGFTSETSEAREAKSYCMGFLYAVITKMEADGSACFGANISKPIEVAADLLGNSAQYAASWDVLEKGYKKAFPCS